MIINICVKILIVYGRKNLIICSIMQCFSPRTYTDYWAKKTERESEKKKSSPHDWSTDFSLQCKS